MASLLKINMTSFQMLEDGSQDHDMLVVRSQIRKDSSTPVWIVDVVRVTP